MVAKQRDGHRVLDDRLSQKRRDLGGHIPESVDELPHRGSDFAARREPRQWFLAGDPVQVVTFVTGQPQGSRQGAQDLRRRRPGASLLQPSVVVRRHGGQPGNVLAPKPLGTPA
nr:hypothetical protein [Micromonospora pisi]